MKSIKCLVWIPLLTLMVATSSCSRNQGDVLDDTRSCGRYMGRGLGCLMGNAGESRQIRNRDAFGAANEWEEGYSYEADTASGDYYALGDVSYPQARELPGDMGSSIPGLEAFSDPSRQPQLAAIFQNIHFDYDSPLVKGDDNMQIVHHIATYLRNHPTTYVFVEGHTDDRGAEAYNLGLGANRANTVRNLLIDNGVSPDHLFTVSYGKERPLVMERHEEARYQNRRAEFKVYQR